MKGFQIAKSRGYTLVEILVVIVIIALLAAVSYPIIIRQLIAGKETKARDMVRHLEQGIADYKQDNNFFPIPSDATVDPTADGGVDTLRDGFLVKSLLGIENGLNNEAEKKYFGATDANSDNEDGLVWQAGSGGTRTLVGLADPWGRGYGVILDYDGNGEVTPSDHAGAFDYGVPGKSGQIVHKMSAIFSYGGNPDKDSNGDITGFPDPILGW